MLRVQQRIDSNVDFLRLLSRFAFDQQIRSVFDKHIQNFYFFSYGKKNKDDGLFVDDVGGGHGRGDGQLGPGRNR